MTFGIPEAALAPLRPRRIEVIVQGSGASRAVPVGGHLTIGRGPDNDVVIPEGGVSANHALVRRIGERVWIKDLGSRNGTRVDGRPLGNDTSPWPPGSIVRIGSMELVLRFGELAAGGWTGLAVEDLSTGVRFALRQPRVVIGGGPDADLHVPGPDRVVLACRPDGALEVDGRRLAHGDAFTVSGLALRVVDVEDGLLPTAADAEGPSAAYVLEAALDAPGGAWARVTDPGSGRSHTFAAPNRVALLYFLARAHVGDAGRPADEVGWRSNAEVCVAVWGRARRGHDPRLLKALIHNVRAELKAAGLDPWCLEKRRGYLRLRVRAVKV